MSLQLVTRFPQWIGRRLGCALILVSSASGLGCGGAVSPDSPPAVSVSTASLPAGVRGSAYTTTLVATGGTGTYTWSVASGALPAGLTLNATTGVLSGTPSAHGTFTFTAQASSGEQLATKSLALIVSPPPVNIYTASLPSGVRGSAYTTPLGATGGTGTYTWSVASGALPTGLTLGASTGVLAGTPSADGSFTFSVQASSGEQSATKSLALVVSPPVSITTVSLPSGLRASAYATTLLATGGTGDYKWFVESGELPPGLTLGIATGVLSGTPTAYGSFTFVAQVTSGAQSESKSFTLTINWGLTSVENAIRSHFLTLFGESVPRPLVVSDPSNFGCTTIPARAYSTAYFRIGTSDSSRLLELITTPDGATVERSSSRVVLTPLGTFRVLTVIVAHPATIGSSFAANWQVAQAEINAVHQSFAQSKGLSSPLVTFVNTNETLLPSEIPQPNSLAGVTAALAAKGISTESYDFVASVNFDPAKLEGGAAHVGTKFIYLGNFKGRTTELTASDTRDIAYALYHHEVDHHWGWPGTHDWPMRCGIANAFAPLIFDPAFFGWTDIDGDGVIEILSPFPYGRGR